MNKTVDPCTKKIRFSIKDFFRKCDQIRSFMLICSHLLKKSLMKNFTFLCSGWCSFCFKFPWNYRVKTKIHENRVSILQWKEKKTYFRLSFVQPMWGNTMTRQCQQCSRTLCLALRTIPKFHLMSWCRNFVETLIFHRVSGDSRKTLGKLCVSTNFPHQEIRWNYSILCCVDCFRIGDFIWSVYSCNRTEYGKIRATAMVSNFSKVADLWLQPY